MSFNLRPYQQQIEDDIFSHWRMPRIDGKRGQTNVMAVSPTGSGKTAIMSSVVKKIQNPTVSIAHRQELVSQISVALAKNDIYHRVVAPEPVIRFCITRHIDEVGMNYHHPKAPAVTSGVQTIIRRGKELAQVVNHVQMWNIDEGHHVLPDNVWGKASNMFPNAWGVAFTASPIRADRQPLGRVNGGLFDYMVQGPTMRELINAGYLCDYRLFAPTISINREEIPVSEATGDFKQNELRKAAHKSRIVGDMVENYVKFANGKRAIAFVVDIEQAKQTAQSFNDAGISAMAVSSKTPDRMRQDALNKFRDGHIKVLVNVDLFGEGYDCPAVEVVIMGRPTDSFGLYLQQFGRALRLLEGKVYGIIIDHVGNHIKHGLPDARRVWSLELDLRGSPRGLRDPNVMPTRRCVSCLQAYEAITRACPHCGHYDEPENRSAPEFVDGDLYEIDPLVLEQMRNKVSNIEQGQALVPNNISDPAIIGAIHKNFRKRQEALSELRDVINIWGGMEKQLYDRTDRQAYSVFYHKFGVDVLNAQAMKTAEMIKLTETIRGNWI